MTDDLKQQFHQFVDAFIQDGWKTVSFSIEPPEAIVRRPERTDDDGQLRWVCRRLCVAAHGTIQQEAIPCPSPYGPTDVDA